MKKKILLSILMFLPMLAIGQTLLYENDFTGITSFDGWSQFGEEQTDGKVDVDPDGLAITVGIQTGQLWQPQIMVVPDGMFNLEEGSKYTVVVTAKFPTAGTLQINMGKWDANDQAQFPVEDTGDFQEVVCEFTDWSVDAEGAHLLFMCGDFKGTTILKKIEIWKGEPLYKGEIYYNFIENGKIAEVIQNPNKYKGNIIIPEKVTHEGVEYTVKKIGDYAFSDCNGLTSITIPNSVTSIGSYAFDRCSGLTSITIPNSVTSIGSDAFRYCSGLTSIIIESGNIMYDSRDNCNAIIEKSSNTLITGCKNSTIPNSVTSIGQEAFSWCTGLTSITIPNSVTSIGYQAFYLCSGLTYVTIPNSVTSIGGDAFYNCSGLTSITIPNSITYIGDYSFGGCSGLTSINIPNSVTSIGEGTFYGCSGLTSIIVESGNTMYDSRDNCNAIIEKSSNTLIRGCKNSTIPNSVTSIGYYAFSYCNGLTSITIPNSVTSIGESAFFDCSGLTSITIPNSVTSIGNNAFYGCSGLTSITIPNSVTSIGRDAFNGCSGLTTIVTEIENPFEIEDNVFYCYNKDIYTTATLIVPPGKKYAYQNTAGWKKFQNIVEIVGVGQVFENSGIRYKIGENNTVSVVSRAEKYSGDVVIPSQVSNGSNYKVTAIGASAFSGCSGLTSITIPNSVTSIGHGTFSGCSGLTSITIPNGVTYIGMFAFEGCSGLTSVTIPNKVTSINNSAFKGCSSLTSVTIGSSVTSIGDNVFRNCSGLTSITIPNSVTSIGGYAFYGCSGLTSVTIPNSVTSIGGAAFEGCSSLTSVTIPNSVTSIGSGTFQYCTGLTSVTIPNSVTSIGGAAFRNCSSLTSVTIPNSVTSIDSYVFYGCSGLTSITIPNSVTSIDNYVFYGCSGLTSITIPSSVTSIGSWTFFGCSSLTSITIPNSVTSIGDNVFRDCSGLNSIQVESGNTKYDSRDKCNAIIETSSNTLIAGCKNTIIPNSVTSIGDNAFYGCSSLTSITIPNSVTSIGGDAFTLCSGLTSVHISDIGAWCKILFANPESNPLYNAHHLYLNGEEVKELVIPNNITTIGNFVFYGCRGLTSVTIPDGVIEIKSYAFADCTELISVSIPNSVTKIEEYAFENCDNVELVIPEHITKRNVHVYTAGTLGNLIGDGDFMIEELTISGEINGRDFAVLREMAGRRSDWDDGDPLTTSGRLRCIDFSNVKIVGDGSSYMTWSDDDYCCYHLDLENDNVIPEGVFRDCTGLNSITLPNNLTSIGGGAFSGCSGLSSISIPNSVTSIGWQAFRGCTSLSTIKSEIPEPFELDNNCFDSSIYSTATLIVPAGKKNIYKNTAGWNNFQNIVEVGGVGYEFEAGGIRYRIYENNTLCVIERNEKYEGILIIPKTIVYDGKTFTVTGIGENAFYGCDNLQEIIIPQTAYDNGIPARVTKFTTYSKNPMRVEVVSKGVVSATMKIYPIDEQGNTNESNCYTVTTSGQTPGQYIKWKLDDENYGIISEKAEGTLILETQPAQLMSTTKARLIAVVNEADDDTHYGFEWLRYNAPDEMPPYKVLTPLYNGQIVGSLGGLDPDVYYKYRPFYQSDSGEMVYGEWIPFLTGDANVFFEPETHTKEAEGVSATGALLSGVWIEGTEDIQEKGFEYWTILTSNTRAVGNDAKTMVVSGNNTTVTIDGLVPGKEYGYRSYVKTESGTTYGEEMKFKTVLIGDVNGDGELNEADAKAIADHIMGNAPIGFNAKEADINGDNDINVIDIVRILNMIK